jgi:hypothetical protein
MVALYTSADLGLWVLIRSVGVYEPLQRLFTFVKSMVWAITTLLPSLFSLDSIPPHAGALADSTVSRAGPLPYFDGVVAAISANGCVLADGAVSRTCLLPYFDVAIAAIPANACVLADTTVSQTCQFFCLGSAPAIVLAGAFCLLLFSCLQGVCGLFSASLSDNLSDHGSVIGTIGGADAGIDAGTGARGDVDTRARCRAGAVSDDGVSSASGAGASTGSTGAHVCACSGAGASVDARHSVCASAGGPGGPGGVVLDPPVCPVLPLWFSYFHRAILSVAHVLVLLILLVLVVVLVRALVLVAVLVVVLLVLVLALGVMLVWGSPAMRSALDFVLLLVAHATATTVHLFRRINAATSPAAIPVLSPAPILDPGPLALEPALVLDSEPLTQVKSAGGVVASSSRVSSSQARGFYFRSAIPFSVRRVRCPLSVKGYGIPRRVPRRVPRASLLPSVDFDENVDAILGCVAHACASLAPRQLAPGADPI